jgi:DNA-binding transcriptional MerR regulator
MKLVSPGVVMKATGVTPRQLRAWVDQGLVRVEKVEAGGTWRNKFPEDEIQVIYHMVRIVRAGISKPSIAASIARKHVRDVEVLVEMGYDQVSSSTEHSIGDGVVLMITGRGNEEVSEGVQRPDRSC